jgi:hypothetical protein
MLHYHEKRIACLDELAVFGPVEEQKNIMNLAYFLGYRPKNLEDL